MKKLLLSLLFFILPLLMFSQSICFSKKDEMQLMASNKSFIKSHALPKAYHHISKAGGVMVEFNTPDGTMAKGFYIPARQNQVE